MGKLKCFWNSAGSLRANSSVFWSEFVQKDLTAFFVIHVKDSISDYGSSLNDKPLQMQHSNRASVLNIEVTFLMIAQLRTQILENIKIWMSLLTIRSIALHHTNHHAFLLQ